MPIRLIEKKEKQDILKTVVTPSEAESQAQAQTTLPTPSATPVTTPVTTPTKVPTKVITTPFLSFDIPAIDNLIGNMFGKITPGVYMIGGKAGVGKTSMLLHLLAKVLKSGFKGKFVDTEFAIDRISGQSDRLIQISKSHGLSYDILSNSVENIMSWDDLISKIRADIPAGGYKFYAIDSITTPWNYEFFDCREKMAQGVADESIRNKLGLLGQQRAMLAIFFNMMAYKQKMYIFMTSHVKSEFMQKQKSSGKELSVDEMRMLGTEYPLLGGGELFYQSKFWIFLTPKMIKTGDKTRIARMMYLGKHKSKADYKISQKGVEFKICDGGITSV